MENFYRYKVEPFHWMFTDRLKSAATTRYDLCFDAERRLFILTVRRRHNHFGGWNSPAQISDEARIEAFRSQLPAKEIAACVAASMTVVTDADA